MIPMPPPVFPAISADASLRASSRQRKQSWFAVLCAFMAVLLCGAASIASAQTAHFSGSTPVSWVQSSTKLPGINPPGGIAVDKSGNIYLADQGQVVYKFTPSGGIYVQSSIGTGLGAVFAVAVDGNGNVYIGDVLNHQVVKEAPSGSSYIQSVVASSSGPNTFYPWGIAVDGSGNVYIEDHSNNQVLKETLSGASYSQSTVVSGLQYGISSIAADASGNVYFTDEFDHAAVKETLVSGNYYQSFVGNTGGYCIPNSVAVDANGNVFIAGEDSITVGGNITYTGAAFVETPLGNSYVQSTISLGQDIPGGIAADGNGNFYIAGSGFAMLEESPVYGNFGTVNLGSTTSKPISMIFTFDTAGTLGSTAVLTQGATGMDFSDTVYPDTCVANTAYTAGQTCTVNVTFKPRFSGTRYGAVVLNDTSGNVLATGYLQGMGVGPQINFLPNTESTVASASSGLDAPLVVAVDGSGNLYVADAVANLILKETPSAGGYTQTTVPTSGLNNPTGIAVDGSGSIYVADYLNLRVLKETPSASGGYKESVVASFSTDTGIVPIDVAVDSIGNVYIVDGGNGLVLKETLSAGSYTQSTIPTPGIFRIGGIAVDGSGDVYVGENDNNNTFMEILKEVPVMDGYAQSIIPAPGVTGIGEVAVDEDGNVYICDNVNNTVLKETLSAGNYTQSEISTSSLNDPQGVAVDGGGNVYIVDANNVRVLKEDFAGPPSLTFASATVGSTSTDSPQTVTVENIGNAALSFPIPSTGNNPSIAANFTLNSSGFSACPLLSAGSSTAGTLAAGASCLLPISFTPTSAGALGGSLVLTDNNLNAAAPGYATQTILLSGTGVSATPAITWSTPAAITYGTPLSATQLDATTTVAGTFTYSPAAGTVLGAGQQTLTVTFTPTDSTHYTPASASVALTVNKATPTITWATPKAITYGTALSATQLNASSTVAATFTYSPAAGTVLAAGAQTLKVTLAPKDSADYTTAAGSVTLTVNPAPSFTLAASPASLTVTQGASGKSTIAVTALNGFTGKVTLAASGLPTGVTASFATNPTTGTSVLTLGASNTAVTGSYKVTITGTSGSLTATTTVTLTVNGFACHIGYTIESQWKGGFEAAITINNTGVKAISNWTLTWTFANGQKITSIWDGADTQSGANVTVTNTSYNGSIPAGGSYTGLGFNASWNNTTNAVPTSFAVNGTTCK